MRAWTIFLILLLLVLPGVTISEDAEIVQLRRQVQQLQAELIRVKADAYDRIVQLDRTTQAANDAIREGVRLAKANGNSTLIAGLKKAGYPF